MAPSSVTCPHCHTSFRITSVQFKAAKGSVRCGSCLQIFNAQEQIEAQQEPPAVNASTQTLPKAETQAPKPSSTSHGEKKAPPARPAEPEKVADYGYQPNIDSLIDELNNQEIHTKIGKQQRRQKQKHWLIMAVTLILLLTLQAAWFNRNSWSLNPTLRPAYGGMCYLLDCDLPPLVNLKAIRSLDLVVRSHPHNKGALQVDAVIVNEANHPQPFPNLELTFTDINDKLVANRTFSPSEYLGGELAGSDEMPSAQPIRIRLDILDPGDQAVSYRLTFSENHDARFN